MALSQVQNYPAIGWTSAASRSRPRWARTAAHRGQASQGLTPATWRRWEKQGPAGDSLCLMAETQDGPAGQLLGSRGLRTRSPISQDTRRRPSARETESTLAPPVHSCRPTGMAWCPPAAVTAISPLGPLLQTQSHRHSSNRASSAQTRHANTKDQPSQ